MTASYQAMLATALRYADGDRASRIACWRQIVDIVGQAGLRIDGEARRQALAALATLAADVPVAQRRLASASLAGRVADSALVDLFANDIPAVAAPMLARLVVGDDRWEELIPALPAASRNILRNRRDLGQRALLALARFAAADLTLPAAPDDQVPVSAKGSDEQATGTTPIVDLVERIARYRQRQPADDGAGTHDRAAVGHAFTFETDDEGTIAWVEGVPRGAVVGVSLAEAADPGGAGVDAAVAGAWRRRAPLGPSRLLVVGTGSASGDWTIEAAPLFNPRDGRFVGYRGEGRRPQAGERAAAFDDGTVATRDSDSLRQLVHELRTPLNAVQGFAAMIEEQMLGPAALPHRASARAIVAEVERLVELIDELDLAAQLDAGRSPPAAEPIMSLGAAVAQAVAAQRVALAARAISVTLTGAPSDEEPTRSSDRALQGIVARLLAAVAATAAPDEVVTLAVEPRGGREVLQLRRTAALRGVGMRDLLDPDFDLEGRWPNASLLGLGFTLRLCARLATERGGRLAILPDALELTLPASEAGAAYIAR